MNSTLRDAGATIAGALFISFSIAPTEEIPMLTANLSSLGAIVLVFFSLIVSYAITFEAGFANQQGRRSQKGVFQSPLSETVFSYLLSLIVAAALLWAFKQLEVADPLLVWLERTIVLGLPATIGGSAGRLAVGG
jgi:putative integral membrane protein (TIGR02587 family)